MHRCKSLLISTLVLLVLAGSALAGVPRFAVISDPQFYEQAIERDTNSLSYVAEPVVYRFPNMPKNFFALASAVLPPTY